MLRKVIFLLFLTGWQFLAAQPDLPAEDPTAAELVSRGKAFLEARQYYDALLAFESAAQRPFNQTTTAAIYLSGLTCFRVADYRKAEKYFEQLLDEYPYTRYYDETRYHVGMIYLRQQNTRKNRVAINSLLDIASNTRDMMLKKDALDRVRHFLFYEASFRFVEETYEYGSEIFRPLFLEALCYHLVEDNRREEALNIYNNFQYQYSDSLNSVFLKQLFGKEEMVRYIDADIIRMAVFMPVFLQDYTRDSLGLIPQKSRLALDFYEGLEMALEETREITGKNIYVRIFDTRRDSFTTREQLRELEELQPDLIIGGIYNTQSRVIAKWAENHRTPQLIPLSPTDDLVRDKSQVFLVHPSASRHGEVMATYAWDSLRLNRVAVWTDQRKGTEILAGAFTQTFDTLGGEVIRLEVDSILTDSAKKDIISLVKSLRFQRVDGVYIPIISNQEIAGLILSQISAMNIPVKVMGSPHWWQRYENIDRELKESYELLFSTSFMVDKTVPAYRQFYNAYLQRYQMTPTENNIQGYDLGKYLGEMLSGFDYRNGQSLASYIRNYPTYHGIHIDIDFQEKQSNQFVNIGGFKNNSVIKVNQRPAFVPNDFFQIKE